MANRAQNGPDLDQLRRKAKELLRAYRESDEEAVAAFEKFHPRINDADGNEAARPNDAKLSDAQLVVARAMGVKSWPRLIQAMEMTSAIHRNDADAVRALIDKHPELLHEDAQGKKSNWGAPMSYAANLGRDKIIRMLMEMGAKDVQHAFDRACLQGKLETARWLFENGARLERGIVMNPCETLNAEGLGFLLELGAELCDEKGDRRAPLGMLLQTYSRAPEGKHRCLELVNEQGLMLPDTPVMAMHRGRIDLLEDQLQHDPDMLNRRFSYRDVYPLEAGCHDDDDSGLHGTPLEGTTLLHMCVDFDEIEIARWLLDKGVDVDAAALVDSEGFGGQTPLFHSVVSQAACNGRQRDGEFTRLLLDAGADVNPRVSIRKAIRFVEDESVHEFKDVTPLSYGEAFHYPQWVNRKAMELIAERGGTV